MERLNKKGQLGLSIVKAVMLAFLIISIIAVTVILSITNLRDVADEIDKRTETITNASTIGVLNDTVGTNVTGTANLRKCSLTATTVSTTVNANATCAVEIAPANYTITGCSIEFTNLDVVSAACYNNTIVNVTGSYSHSAEDASDISKNISSGVTELFDDTGTIFAILVVVVIILAISIIIAVVSRFGGAAGGGISLGRGEKGEETVMGI